MRRRPLRILLVVLAIFAVLFVIAALGGVRVEPLAAPARVAHPTAFAHDDFTRVLAAHVDTAGLVDYAGLKQTRALDGYLARLAATDPDSLGETDRLAFWLNAYNAHALKLIVDNYPVSSILHLTPYRLPGLPLTIPGTSNDPFALGVARVGGKLMSLNDIEHGVVRKDFREPRVHAALVCAAMSCPPLRREAYEGGRLSVQLEDQMRTWLRDPRKNRIPDGAETIRVSKIFDWFKGDFGGTDATVQAALAPYFEGDVRARLERGAYAVDHVGYRWGLNDVRLAAERPPLP